MTKLIEALRADARRAALLLVQGLNAAAMSAIAGAVVVHETYPDVLRTLLAKLPPVPAAIALFLFGAVVHLGIRKAKKEAASLSAAPSTPTGSGVVSAAPSTPTGSGQ